MSGQQVAGTPSLAEARLIRRLGRGDSAALDALWTRWRNPVWSVLRGVSPDHASALALLEHVYRALPEAARTWAPDHPLACLVAGWVLRSTSQAMGISWDGELDQTHSNGAAAEVDGPEEVRRLAALPPGVRLAYLLDLFFECPVATTAGLGGASEAAVRGRRSAGAWAVAGLTPEVGLAGASLVPTLPCYLSDDLPAGWSERVQAALEADPELSRTLDVLSQARGACRAAVQVTAPMMPAFGTLMAPPAPPESGARLVPEDAAFGSEVASTPTLLSPAGGRWRSGAVVAALCAVVLSSGAVTTHLAPAASPGLAYQAVAQLADTEGLPGFHRASDIAELKGALAAAGAAPALVDGVMDLSAQRLALVGGGVVHGPRRGVAVVYARDGRRFVVQIYPDAGWGGRPDQVVRTRRALLRGFDGGAESVVSWSANGRLWLFSGPESLDRLLAMVAVRMGGATG